MRITQRKQSQRLRLAACWVAGAVSVMSLTSATAEPAQPSRDLIVVEGNRRVDAATVRSYFHAAPNGKFDDAARDAALKTLIATGLFDKVSIDRSGERLVVHLSEAPVLDRVAFEGNKSGRKALGDAVLVRPDEAVTQSAGGVEIPDEYRDRLPKTSP